MRQRKPNPHHLAEVAHSLRHHPTHSEAALWRELSGSKLGVAFRRQVPLAGRYIVDFVAPKPRLVIEVDGASHKGRDRADARRDRVLEELGYRVLRLDAKLVIRQPLEAVARVRRVLGVG